ncbi:MAG: deoxyuridine 5'-triphosphate nucleotidohydrolase, partial [Clostridiales bacterium]|nr:deoxyuridine 5'-triphosphate nucleotidohydrolase [Clostridiales bacterium]
MKRIARFEKVTKEQFCEGYRDCFGEDGDAVYETLTLPRRATAGSAGYDFCTPRALTLAPGETVKIPTGIRVWMEDGWVLKIYPRSGLGFKYRLQLNNTVGIIDSDYYHASNEGHIFIKPSTEQLEAEADERQTHALHGVLCQSAVAQRLASLQAREEQA